MTEVKNPSQNRYLVRQGKAKKKNAESWQWVNKRKSKRSKVIKYPPAKYKSNGVVEHAFPEYEGVQIHIHVQVGEYGEYRERVGGAHQGPEVKRVEEGEAGGQVLGHQLHEAVHQQPDEEGRHCGADYGVGQYSAQVAKEIFLKVTHVFTVSRNALRMA